MKKYEQVKKYGARVVTFAAPAIAAPSLALAEIAAPDTTEATTYIAGAGVLAVLGVLTAKYGLGVAAMVGNFVMSLIRR